MNREWVRYPFHLIFHPFDGYWELKYDRGWKSGVISSCIILLLLAVTNIMQQEYSGFLVNFADPRDLNSLLEILYVIVPVLFWCVANWSLTTLMDGEGKFVDIFTSTCYALLPLVLIRVPWLGLSHVISMQETAFYHFSENLAVLWCLFLLFVGNMTAHQYTPSKTGLTLLLSVVAMGFLAFLSLLFFSLVQEIVSFIYTIYQELTLRG